ncbi:LytR/AlgR family response regulator transcription factor [Aquimarina pacifica]|uniref:LytR/AlgR family response regulator transcription factor n=1 Tax=Aquimarina pacifica TaxID=1296415 RepID=UPI0004727C10|nr:LytTR family DNA-binding domain-containing protein [Aquimarina pacifica]
MRKDHLYLLTFIAITVIFLIVASFSVKHFIMESSDQLIVIQLESGKREADEMSQMISTQLSGGIKLDTVKVNIQSAIEKTHEMTSFVSVMDWSGKQICHPNITKVGEMVNSDQNLLDALKEKDRANKLYEILVRKKKETNSIEPSEIVYLSPVKGTDLIVTSNFNLDKIITQTGLLKNRYYRILFLMGGFIILCSFFAVRTLGSLYEKQLELKNTALENELFSLSKLNKDLIEHQQKIIEEKTSVDQSQDQSIEEKAIPEKKRILTYIRNELVPISTNQISYIKSENSITYIYGINGKKSTTSLSLDELYNTIDKSLFFRANRQFIISISSIDKIVKYGNSQLKILIQNSSDVEIIISKNKAAEFRQWLSI